ncbi:WhiB family transcriptional regulator [Kitasatospora sp. NPDC127116]|uniref:WhiB family transcriptional regulator n=1 Tax=Kitasatospora sp. NPDC127116 TaxID=3345367 RepID=UPI003637E7CA
MSWGEFATCRAEGVDTELFYPVSYSNATGLKQVAEAREYCDRCPVVAACLQNALDREGKTGVKGRHGIQGGKTPGERAELSKKKRLAPAA